MKADQLAQEIQEARIEEFGEDQGTERFPAKYFNSGVYVTAPDGRTTPRNPRYCATDFGAAEIANVLSASGRAHLMCSSGEKRPAMPGWSETNTGAWKDSETVPYLRFRVDVGKTQDPESGPYTGPLVNAALLLDYFNHGYPASRALNSCQLEVWDQFAAAGLIEELSEEERNAIMAQA